MNIGSFDTAILQRRDNAEAQYIQGNNQDVKPRKAPHDGDHLRPVENYQ